MTNAHKKQSSKSNAHKKQSSKSNTPETPGKSPSNETSDKHVKFDLPDDLEDPPRMEEDPVYIEDILCYRVFIFLKEWFTEFYRACGRHKRRVFSICLIILAIAPFLWINITIFPDSKYEVKHEYTNSMGHKITSSWYPAYLLEFLLLVVIGFGTFLHTCSIVAYQQKYEQDETIMTKNKKWKRLDILFVKYLEWIGKGNNVSECEDIYFFIWSHVVIRLVFLYVAIPIMHYYDVLASFFWIPLIIAAFPIILIYGIYYVVISCALAIYYSFYYTIRECCIKPVRACRNGRNNQTVEV